MVVKDDAGLKSLLDVRTIAVVGMSKDPKKYSRKIGAYLKGHGYHIIPVNPTAEEILGEKSYPSLLDIPEELQKEIGLVDIFRPPEDVPLIVAQAVELRRRHGRLRGIWMQLDIVNEAAAELAENSGLEVVMDRCIMVEHKRLKQAVLQGKAPE
ncbi:MAG: CoA-binding protein [Candidatus Hadarchaeum sp.]|uniref:CoA-binding protein n=1 Tax=Candidatus Hadarchaeum sp. TaxID=2883567 RepID=UPI003D12A508